LFAIGESYYFGVGSSGNGVEFEEGGALELIIVGLHLNIIGLHLNIIGLHLNIIGLHLNIVGLHLNIVGLHLNNLSAFIIIGLYSFINRMQIIRFNLLFDHIRFALLLNCIHFTLFFDCSDIV